MKKVLALSLFLCGCANSNPPFLACQVSTGQAFVAQATSIAQGYAGGGFYLPEVNVMCPQPLVTSRPFVAAQAASTASSGVK